MNGESATSICGDYNVHRSYIYDITNRYIGSGTILTPLERHKLDDKSYHNSRNKTVLIPPIQYLIQEQYKENNQSTLREYKQCLNEYNYDASF